jgi:hypothetical protein
MKLSEMPFADIRIGQVVVNNGNYAYIYMIDFSIVKSEPSETIQLKWENGTTSYHQLNIYCNGNTEIYDKILNSNEMMDWENTVKLIKFDSIKFGFNYHPATSSSSLTKNGVEVENIDDLSSLEKNKLIIFLREQACSLSWALSRLC